MRRLFLGLFAGLCVINALSFAQVDDLTQLQNDTRRLAKEVDAYRKKYRNFQNEAFDRLEARTKKAYEAVERAYARHASQEEIAYLRRKYFRARHFELTQKLLTFQGKSALFWENVKKDFWQGVYEDTEYIVRNIDWKKVFENFTQCFQELDVDKCKDMVGSFKNLALEMIEKTWKRRFVVDFMKKSGCTKKIAESVWDDLVLPEVADMPFKKYIDQGIEKMQEKGKEKMTDEIAKRVKQKLLAEKERILGKTEEEIKKTIKEEAEKTAEDVFAAVTFLSDVFWKSVNITAGTKLAWKQLHVIQKQVELCKKAAGCDCPDRINYYYFNQDALKKKLMELRKKKVSVGTIPQTIHPQKSLKPINPQETNKQGGSIDTLIKESRKKRNRHYPKFNLEAFKKRFAQLRSSLKKAEIGFSDFKRMYIKTEKALRDIHHTGFPVPKDNKEAEWQNKQKARIAKLLHDAVAKRKEIERYYNALLDRLNKENVRFQKTYKKTRGEIRQTVLQARDIMGKIRLAAETGDVESYTSYKNAYDRVLSRIGTASRQCEETVKIHFDILAQMLQKAPQLFWNNGFFDMTLTGLHSKNAFFASPLSLQSTYIVSCSPSYKPEFIPTVALARTRHELEKKVALKIVDGEKERTTQKDISFIQTTSLFGALQSEMEEFVVRNKLYERHLRLLNAQLRQYNKKTAAVKRRIDDTIRRMLRSEIELRKGKISVETFDNIWKNGIRFLKKSYRDTLPFTCRYMRMLRDFSSVYDIKASERKINTYAMVIPKYKKVRSVIERIASRLKTSSSLIRESETLLQGIDRDINNLLSVWYPSYIKTYAKPTKAAVTTFENGTPYNISRRITFDSAKYLTMLFDYLRTEFYGNHVCNFDTAYAFKKMEAYRRMLLKAYRKNRTMFQKMCRFTKQLDALIRQLEQKGYDKAVYEKAGRIVASTYLEDEPALVDFNTTWYKRYLAPNLTVGCNAQKVRERFENYKTPQMLPRPTHTWIDLSLNGKKMSDLKRYYADTNSPKLYDVSPKLHISVASFAPDLKGKVKAIYLRVCPVDSRPYYPESVAMEKVCKQKPLPKVASTLPFDTTVTLPKKGLLYQIDMQVQLLNGANFTPERFPFYFTWLADTTDNDDDEGETSVSHIKGGTSKKPTSFNGGTQTEKKTFGKKRHASDTVVTKKQPGTTSHSKGKDKQSAGVAKKHHGTHVPHPKNKNKHQNRPDTLCKKEYRAFVKSYNKLTYLMSHAKGDTPQAKAAYQSYLKDKKAYEGCKNRAVRKPYDHSKHKHNGSKHHPHPPMIHIDTISMYDEKRPKMPKGRNGENNRAVHHLGCFKDNNERDLKVLYKADGHMTPEMCKNICEGYGFSFAGVQYATECFCDDFYGVYGKSDACTMPCGGDKTRKGCGGVWANDVYALHPRKKRDIAFERDIDRPGGDYKQITLKHGGAASCQKACLKEEICASWSYVISTRQCWLKRNVPAPQVKRGIVSGAKNGPHHLKEAFRITEGWGKHFRVTQAAVYMIDAKHTPFGRKNGSPDIGGIHAPKGAKGEVLYLHPLSPVEGVRIEGDVTPKPNSVLTVRIASLPQGSFRLAVAVDGKKIYAEEIYGGKWKQVRVPLGKYAGRRIHLTLLCEATGWYFEYAFIDEIKVLP